MGSPSYQLYIDDTGNRNPNRKAEPRKDQMDAFALGGFLIKSEDFNFLEDKVEKFKEMHNISYPLHSTKIRNKKDNFQWLRHEKDRADVFYQDLNSLIEILPIHVTACVIDRKNYAYRYLLQHKEPWLLCKSAYSILVERSAKFSALRKHKLQVFIEQSGKREDSQIRQYHKDMLEKGMCFNQENSEQYSPLNSSELSETLFKNPKFITKKNIGGQIADLVLYPIVKGKYDPSYEPYQFLQKNRKLIDHQLEENQKNTLGIKYYCFK